MPDEPKLTTLAPPSAPPPPTEADYEAIHAAVMDSVRGRWFLGEYARRNRNADTDLILAAIGRVAAPAPERPAPSPADRVRFDLAEMARAIAQTRSEIASIKPEGDAKGSLSEATEELDSIVHTTERATSDILAAAEQMQEIAWTLRERGADPEVCDALDRRATDIYTACSFQDLTGQRTRKVVEVLRFLEERIRTMIDIWGDAGPAPTEVAAAPHIGAAAEELDQRSIDRIMPTSAAAAAPSAEPAAEGHETPAEAALATAVVAAAATAAVPIATDAVVAFAAGDEPAMAPDSEPPPTPASHSASPAAAPTRAGASDFVSPDAAILDALALALSVDPIKPEPAAEPQPGADAVPGAALECEPVLSPEPAAIEAVAMVEPQPGPEVTREPAPVAAPEAALPPEPVAGETPPTVEPQPELDVTHQAEPVAIEAAPAPQPEPETARAPAPAAASEPSPEAAAAAPGAARPDPTEMLRRILALIRPSGAAASPDDPQSTAAEGERFVATIAVSEVGETDPTAASAQAAGAPAAAAAPVRAGNAPVSGPLTVDQAVSELLLKALARAAAAVPSATVAPTPPRPMAAETPAPVGQAETRPRADSVEPVAEQPAASIAAAPRVEEPAVEPEAAVQTEAPVALDVPDVPASLAAEPIASDPAPVAPTPPADDLPAAASAPAKPVAEVPVAGQAPAAAAAPPTTAVVLPLPQPTAPAKPDGLAAFRALSDEDKIALFS